MEIASIKAGSVSVEDLREVQRRREGPVRTAQKMQGYLQERVAAPALKGGGEFRPPLLLRLLSVVPFLRDIPGRLIAFGPRRVRVDPEVLAAR